MGRDKGFCAEDTNLFENLTKLHKLFGVFQTANYYRTPESVWCAEYAVSGHRNTSNTNVQTWTASEVPDHSKCQQNYGSSSPTIHRTVCHTHSTKVCLLEAFCVCVCCFYVKNVQKYATASFLVPLCSVSRYNRMMKAVICSCGL